MPLIATVLIFIAVLAVLIVSHELGHFVTAKMSKVTVEEFGLGFPPRIFGIKRKGTIYSINALPLGGFVKMVGEEDAGQPGGLASKSIWTRILVLSAGSLMNVLLPVLLFSVSFMVPHDVLRESVVIQDVNQASPAQSAGITAGDLILQINGRPIQNRGDVGYDINLYSGLAVTMLVQKPDGIQKETVVTPRLNPPPGQGMIGILIAGKDSKVVSESEPFWQAIPNAFIHSWEILVLFKNAILSWIVAGASPQLTGPIGIAQMTGEVAQAGLSPLLEFAALISLNLAIMNILPFPGLDGGRLAFVVLEAVRRGKKVPAKYESVVHLVGMAILIMLILLVTYNDISRILSGESLIP
jgi:regulator of sigma E protease